MRFIVVNVTFEDIVLGDPGSTDTCPVALALQRRFPDASVYSTGIDLDGLDGPGAPSIPLTRSLEAFINDVDAGEDVKPKRFRIRVPDEVSPWVASK